MPIPSELETLIERLYDKCDRIEQEATEGLNILRRVMSQFPENAILVQYFAYLNALLFFATTSRQQIQTIVNTLSQANIPLEVIQESGEYLGI